MACSYETSYEKTEKFRIRIQKCSWMRPNDPKYTSKLCRDYLTKKKKSGVSTGTNRLAKSKSVFESYWTNAEKCNKVRKTALKLAWGTAHFHGHFTLIHLIVDVKKCVRHFTRVHPLYTRPLASTVTWPKPSEMVWDEMDRRVKAKGPTSPQHELL